VLNFSSSTALPARIGYLIAPADREVSSWTVEVEDLDRLTQVHISIKSPQGNVDEHLSVPHRNLRSS